jgi:hypothetical protein
MKGGVQTALALGVGYVLGRRRKMRLATMLAFGAATGGIAKFGPMALRQGTKYLGSTDIAGALGPQVGEIVSAVRGELLDAAKAAAVASVTSRIDSLSDSLHERADALKNPEAAVAGATETVGRVGDEAVGRTGGTVGRLRRRGRPADAEEDLERDERDEEESRNGRGRRERSQARTSARSEPEDEDEEYEDEEPEEDVADEFPADQADLDEKGAEEPAPQRRRTARSHVTRTRR